MNSHWETDSEGEKTAPKAANGGSFKSKRAAHYNEFERLRAWRAAHANDTDEDEDEDDDEDDKM